METSAAVLRGTRRDHEIETIVLDDPRAGEVAVRLVASGMCHSDEHCRTGDTANSFPLICGHEGAGVVEAVGAGVTRVQPGDHVVFGFVPACGSCPSCATGHSNVCDLGGQLFSGTQRDGTSRHHLRDGTDLRTMLNLGTFARHTVVNEASCVRILDHYPLERACLVGCGVTTGWGSAVYTADVRPGDDVVVVGAGGVGSAAIQGARLAGAERILAIDPVPFKREMATTFGATHTAASTDEALSLLRDVTWGKMAEKVICTMGVGDGSRLQSVVDLAAKRGRVVVTNIHPVRESRVTLTMSSFTFFEKQLVGSLFGSANIHYDIPHLLRLYDQGQLDLDSMVTRTYPLDRINEGYADMNEGRNIRGVLVYE